MYDMGLWRLCPFLTAFASFVSCSSPKSDLDMCLQLPSGMTIIDEEDPTGATAMSRLAQVLEENGMKEVNTARLTARIPVIKFFCPKPLLESDNEGEDALMECDLSMHNPLAVLNTSLLRTYAEINPVTRVMASIIKRWAKARDINNPARHTLSSYGYIMMLVHFLTFHQRSGDGLVSQIAGPEGKPKRQPNQTPPLLPNLQWMDDTWPDAPPGTPYRELSSLPKKIMKHPLEEKAVVNTYYYRPNGQLQLNNLQKLFPGQDLSLAILLASFFRYYAYEFDYKRHVVSLHSTAARGIVEREVKAELDGWRNYSAALTIEDPFETFYDVAHVLRGGYYHRIRREFAVAYSKIADVAAGRTNSSWKDKGVDMSSMTGMDLVDWICEPVSTDHEEV
jgi:DNA polymerase sigma